MDLYMLAWRYGLKGVTVFRENCRRTGILTTEKKEESKKVELPKVNAEPGEIYIPRGYVIPAGDNLIGKKRKLTTGCGSLHCTAFFDPETGDLMETYLSRGSTGGCANSYTGLSRMISLAARAGVPLESIVDQLNSCGICPSYAVRRTTKHDTSPGACCPIAVGKALVEMHDEMMNELKNNFYQSVEFAAMKEQMKTPEEQNILGFSYPEYAYHRKNYKIAFKSDGGINLLYDGVCPECGEPIVHEGGCDICKNCGWSKCH